MSETKSRPHPSWAGAKRFACRDIPFLLVLGLSSLAIMTIPGYPTELDPDFAWNRVLNFAHQQGWQFGPEIAFTYGPFGFLLSPDFAPHAFALRLACEVAVCVTVATGLCLVAWRLGLWWRALLIALFTCLVPNIFPRADLVLYIGLLCWELLCLTEKGRALPFFGIVFIALAAFCALAKINLMLMGGLGIVVLASELWLRGQRKFGVTIVIGYLLTVLFGWVAAGQHLLNLGTFLSHGMTLASGYDQAMGLAGLPALQFNGVLALLPAIATVAFRCGTSGERDGRNFKWRRGLLTVWGLALVFLTWKHAFVMSGLYHAGFFFGFLPVLVLAIDTLPGETPVPRFCSRSLAVLTCLLSASTLQSLVFPSLRSALSTPPTSVAQHLAVLLHPVRYRARMLEKESNLRQAYALPKLSTLINHSTVDVFGLEQHTALFNDLNYRPRPVFQSYSAYSAPLMKLNEEFFLSSRAPDYVLFEFGAVERRFPPLEDAMALRTLLMNYELVDSEGSFLLLKAKSRVNARLELLREGTTPIGAPIEIGTFHRDMLWLEIELEPSVLGRVRRFFFKPPIVRLSLRSEPSSSHPVRFQAPAPMLAAGFIANPILTRREDIVKLYQGASLSRANAYAIEVNPGQEVFWHDTIHFRLYRIAGGEAGAQLWPPGP